MKKTIVTKDAPAPVGPYSQALESGWNSVLFRSGPHCSSDRGSFNRRH